jgi:hypothetical protein
MFSALYIDGFFIAEKGDAEVTQRRNNNQANWPNQPFFFLFLEKTEFLWKWR